MLKLKNRVVRLAVASAFNAQIGPLRFKKALNFIPINCLDILNILMIFYGKKKVILVDIFLFDSNNKRR